MVDFLKPIREELRNYENGLENDILEFNKVCLTINQNDDDLSIVQCPTRVGSGRVGPECGRVGSGRVGSGQNIVELGRVRSQKSLLISNFT